MKTIHKICKKCGEEKLISEFYFRNEYNTYRSECKKCTYKITKADKIKNKEKTTEYQKNYRIKNKTKLKKYSKNWCFQHRDERKNKYLKTKTEEPWTITYNGIKTRCYNKKSKAYKWYGGRGIKCLITSEELKELWFRDKAYEMKKPSIDRIDNDGNYCIENCRFIELSENSSERNRRVSSKPVLLYLKTNILQEFKSAKEASDFLNIPHSSLCKKLKIDKYKYKDMYLIYKLKNGS
jgi:hypothetical protein